MLDNSNTHVNHFKRYLFYDVKMSLQKRITELLDEHPETKKAALAKFVGVSRTTPTDWTSGKTKNINGEHAYKVAEFFGNIEPYWVQTGKGQKYKPTAQIAATLDGVSAEIQGQVNPPIKANASPYGGFEPWDDDTPLHDDEVALHFFREVELAAGAGRAQVIENHGRKLRFSKTTLKRLGINIDQAACVTIAGNSMEPVLPDGCTVGIDTSKTAIKNGDLYAIDHDGHLRVKMMYRMPGDSIRLRSFNSDEWPDELYSGESAAKIRIIGRVFWWSVLR